MGKNKAYYATIKLDRVWFIIKDFRLAREEMKNSDSWYKVLTIKSSYSLHPFLSIKSSHGRNSLMNFLPVTPRDAVSTYTYLRMIDNIK